MIAGNSTAKSRSPTKPRWLQLLLPNNRPLLPPPLLLRPPRRKLQAPQPLAAPLVLRLPQPLRQPDEGVEKFPPLYVHY
jgi:hypothetical protein